MESARALVPHVFWVTWYRREAYLERCLVADQSGMLDCYSQPRGGKRTIYDVWEDGQPYRDWVTPSVADGRHRTWMADVLVQAARGRRGSSVLSMEG
jgi:hypothetical protein